MSEQPPVGPHAVECAYHPGVSAIDQCQSCGRPLCAECSATGERGDGVLCPRCREIAKHDRKRHPKPGRDWRRLLRGLTIGATFIVAAGILALLFRGAWMTAEVERGVSGIAGFVDDAERAEMRQSASEAIQENVAEDASADFPAIAERVLQSVVRITTGDIIDTRGSGFVVSSQGDILTAAHVIGGASSPQVTFPDGREFEAMVLFEDSRTDVALLHVDYQGAPALPLGASGELGIGTDVGVLGYPLNQSFEELGFRSATPTLVQGVVAARQAYRPSPLSRPIPVLQIDANLNPGHSGGPVFLRSTGEVVGIANATIRDAFTGKTDVCFAVPIDVARAAIAGG